MNNQRLTVIEEDSLTKYFKDLRKSVLLTADEEVKLAIRIQEGDEKALDILIKANLKFVVSIAKDYQNQGLPLSDLINEGNYGLIKAAHKFDHTRGFKFISYAVWWIRQAIIQSLNENARMVRLPSNVIAKLSSLKKEIEKFEFQNERQPIYGEILDANEIPVELSMYPKCASLNDVINDDGDELIDVISYQNDETQILETRLRDKLNDTLSILDERERSVIESYFGINTICEAMTLEAIGEKYGLTKERIRQIKNRSLRKLKFNSHGLYDLLNE